MTTKPAHTVRRAKRLRREMTPPEVYLWQHFRQQPDGIKIRRQHPFGPYIVDFFCAQAKLSIEVDGIAAADVLKSSGAMADAVFQMIKARIG
jgi:very-short-patch-repair endonuclease